MKTIYILTNGTVLRRTGRRLILEKGKERIFEIPLKDVGRVLIYGRTEVTAQTINAFLEKDIPIYYVRRSGALKGKIVPATGKHVLIRERQHQCFNNSGFAIPLARSIIHTKIQNMQTVIEYLFHKQQGTAHVCQVFHEACQRLMICQTRDEIMGTEGAAARHYFKLYGSNLPESFRFEIRSRQPATDPANALLNLGYMTLLRDVEAHIEAHHLDPYLGVLHATQDGRPSLALDLLEEFRQPVIDIFILKLFNLKQIKPEHFQRTIDGGIEMTEEGFKKFFYLYEERMGRQDGQTPGLRKILDEQVCSIKKHLLGEEPYQHFRLSLSEDFDAISCPETIENEGVSLIPPRAGGAD